jgi:hypothetical protein
LNRPDVNRAMSWLVVGTLGAFEAIYGRTQYLGDWISYLNVSRSVSALEWKGVFDPMWNPGYPVLIALIRAIFPHTVEGEWNAINLLNWLIFLMAYGAWRYLIRDALEFYDPSLAVLQDRSFFLWVSSCAFLSCALCLDRASSVCPDLLVTTLFILAVAQVLSVVSKPSAVRAIGLGVILGAGYWAKSVFLSLDAVFVLVLLLLWWSKKLSLRLLSISLTLFLFIVVPYVVGISISYGKLTLGASGALNYAFHVNHMPHWTNWQGGPPVFGAPLNPTRQLISDLPVFEFGTPFKTTYPPYNNISYWYRGFSGFYSPKLHAIAIARNCYFLVGIVKRNPFLPMLLLALLIIVMKREWRTCLCAKAKAFWPMFLPAGLGVIIYLGVHVEDRYISPFCLVASLLPLLPLLNAASKSRQLLATFLFILYTGGAATELAVCHASTVRSVSQQDDHSRDSQWKLATALSSYGLQGGDAVALIDERYPPFRCHWAYISGLRIVAEFGSLPWTRDPWDHTKFEHIEAEQADQDYSFVFWKKLTAERRAEVIEKFRLSGARAVLALSGPDVPDPGWQEIVGTDAWIYRFRTDAEVLSARN